MIFYKILTTIYFHLKMPTLLKGEKQFLCRIVAITIQQVPILPY